LFRKKISGWETNIECSIIYITKWNMSIYIIVIYYMRYNEL